MGVLLGKSRLWHHHGIPLIRVAGGQWECTPGAVAANHDWRSIRAVRARHQEGLIQLVKLPTEVRGFIAMEQARDHLQTFRETNEPAIGADQIEAEGLVFTLLPTRTESKLEPTAGKIVDVARRPGSDHWITKRDWGNEWSKLNPSGIAGEPGQRRP